MHIRRTFHDLQRLRQIIAVLVKYGFGYVVERLHLDRSFIGRSLLTGAAVRRSRYAGMPAPVRFRKVLEELGPTFIKFGQVLSTRPDLVPPEYTRELARLQDEVPGFGYEQAREVVREELGRDPGQVFVGFQPAPLASASLAQVHEARLPTGEQVIVKVQRPGIAGRITADLEILSEIARLAERYVHESRFFDPSGVVEEFRRTITKELDFRNESYNVDLFGSQFRGDDRYLIPRVFHSVSTRRVLVLEKIEGIKISDLRQLDRLGFDRKRLARNGADAVLKQVFDTGTFHADPHPGNLMVTFDGRIAFLDFGMVGRLPPALKVQLGAILISFVQRDIPEMREAFLSVGKAETDVDVPRLDVDLEEIVDRYYARPLGEINVGQVLLELIHIVTQYRIRLPSDLFLLSKVLITLESVGRTLDPGFNLVEQARPFVEEMERRRYSPAAIAESGRKFAAALVRFARSLPRDLTVIFGKLKQGTLKVEFEHRGLESLTAQIGRASSRIALGVVIAAMLIGSAIIMHVQRGPEYMGFPVFGLVVFIAAVILSLWLIIVILSSEKL